jgi:hypothetical protein
LKPIERREKVKRKHPIIQGWESLVANIPDDLEASAREYGVLARHRKIKRTTDLLRLILIYALLLSLRSTAIWGVGLGICDVSRQNLEKRFLKSGNWLRYLLNVVINALLEVSIVGSGAPVQRIVLRDASVIARPGSSGTEWRLHLSWSPFSQLPTQVTLTDRKGSEGLEDAGLQAGDLVVADRAYAIWRTLQVVLKAQAFFIIRLTWSNLPLVTLVGEPFDLVSWLRHLPESQEYAEVTVAVADDARKRPLRIVAGRLPREKAIQAQERVKREARKQKRDPNPITLFVAGFCILITNLPSSWQMTDVLGFYRIRWQIEWCFRRMKSICHLDHLPATPAPIAEIVLLAKLLLVLLLQLQSSSLPWQDWWTPTQPGPVVSTVVQLVYLRICEAICQSSIVIDAFFVAPERFERHLRSSRRKRSLQLSEAAKSFARLLPDLAPG